MNSRFIPFVARFLGMCIGLSFVAGCGQATQPSPQPTVRSSVADTVVPPSTDSTTTPTIPTVNPLPPVGQPIPGTDRIAYVQTRDRVVGVYDIYTAKPDGSEPKRITRSSALDTQPAWSPDSQSIVFVSTIDSAEPGDCTSGFVEFRCNFDIYTISATEEEATPKRLTTSSNFDRDPDWSPDGTKIVYSSREAGAPFSFIVVMNADGSEPQVLTFPSSASTSSPRWSPDGTKIAFTREDRTTAQIWVMNADGSDAHQLLHDDRLFIRATWSPDGTKIAATQASGQTSVGKIVVANADGTDIQILDDPRVILGYSVAWSPDSSQLLYVTDLEEMPGMYNLGMTNVDGTVIHQTLFTTKAFFTAPAWSLGTQ